MKRTLLLFGLLMVLFGGAAPALAQREVKLTVGDPTNDGTVEILLRDWRRNVIGRYSVPIPANLDAGGKARLMAETLNREMAPITVTHDGANGMTFENLPDNVKSIAMDTGTTAEKLDTWRVYTSSTSWKRFRISFKNLLWRLLDIIGGPAKWKIGIKTDRGEIDVELSAEELNDRTDGYTICRLLVDKLEPFASEYGFRVFIKGEDFDEIEIYIDPNYTLQGSGGTFGTTSPSEGCFGEITTFLGDCPSETCNGLERLKAKCVLKGCGNLVKGVMTNGTPGAVYGFTTIGGDCFMATANDRGKIVVKDCYGNVGEGVVSVTNCGLSQTVICP